MNFNMYMNPEMMIAAARILMNTPICELDNKIHGAILGETDDIKEAMKKFIARTDTGFSSLAVEIARRFDDEAQEAIKELQKRVKLENLEKQACELGFTLKPKV